MMQPSSSRADASNHAKYLLSATENALLTNNFALFRSCFAFPNVIETSESKCTLRTVTAFKEVFDAIVHEHQKTGVTHIVRDCKSAEYLDEQTFVTQHETRMVAHGQLINDAFLVDSKVGLFNGRWQIMASRYSLNRTTQIGRLLDPENSF